MRRLLFPLQIYVGRGHDPADTFVCWQYPKESACENPRLIGAVMTAPYSKMKGRKI